MLERRARDRRRHFLMNRVCDRDKNKVRSLPSHCGFLEAGSPVVQADLKPSV